MTSEERPAAVDAPTRPEFERLYAAAFESENRQKRIENQFIVFGTGRLGFRSGAALHFNDQWVDRARKIIRVPFRDPCTCRYCREQAEKMANRNEDLTYESALERYWKPKYPASTRAIPYGWSARSIDVVESFLDEIGNLNMAQSTMNRRVDRLQSRAGTPKVYPHALRAAAGFFWAEKGLEPLYLMALMGWDDMRVANRYIRATGRQLNDRIQRMMADEPESTMGLGPDDLPDPTPAVYNAIGEANPRSPTPVDRYLWNANRTETSETTLWDYAD